MKEENRKEILTREIIKKDTKSFLWYNIAISIFSAVMFFVLVLVFRLLFSFSDISNQKLTMLVLILTAVIIAITLVAIARYLKMLLKLKNDCFKIELDKLCDKKVNHYWFANKDNSGIIASKPILPFWINKAPIDLYFARYKKFNLPLGTHYNFSNINKFDYYRMVSSSEIGDEFYLLIIDNRIVEIYNAKLFELRD